MLGNLRILGTDLTAADTRAQIAGLESFALRSVELRLLLDSGQPEAQLVCKIVASSTGTVTLDERCGAEVFQA